MEIVTYNSKHDIYGNRRNLCVNYTTREVWFYGGHCFNLGNIHDGLGIREVNRLHKEFIADGFVPVSHAVVRDTWRS